MSPRPSTGIRERLVQAAQHAFHEQGYHGTSLDTILARARTSKGGMYHHFEDKEALARAVVDEQLNGLVLARWGGTAWHGDPIGYLQGSVRDMKPDHLKLGCPVNSLAQEVAAHEPALRKRLERVFDQWIKSIAAGLRAGIDAGLVRRDVDPVSAATYFLAVWEGFVAIAKTKPRAQAFVQAHVTPMLDWLESLRA